MTNRILASILCGVLFGIGLVVSDMVNPARVLAFLDVAGDWDLSLAFVMGGALIPSSLAYAIKRHRSRPAFDTQFHVPTSRSIDARLVFGAGLFGLGWGLVGLCPGPAIASLVTGRWEAVLFAAAMVAGMFAYRIVQSRQDAPLRHQ
ncbi:putative membrane protein YedE/YeeE [Rhizobium mesoamericanum]|uniref:YeeE/YedE family protein n=1 Tax=Rhizobium mesoamericanum TaxID=1079800 RepID=UPI002782ABEA|nr:YeeE/YedE family protein [Rhizobium mesoamericanum]MDQ0561567.1 putative membrane protein YedE/YeeE [Rhizobium mesoamericanum]